MRILSRRNARALAVIAGLLGASCSQEAGSPPATSRKAPMLVLYTSMPAERIANVASAYAEAAGVIVNYMVDSDEVLIDKLIRKEHLPGADVLLITGAGHLAQAVDSDVLRPITSARLEDTISDALRDLDGYWFGVGVRAELIVYDQRRVAAPTLGGYADLADESWHGKLCLQRSIHERSRSLVAALIAEHGERQAEMIVRGWRANFATSVFDSQRDLLLAIESGACGVGVASSDEVARFVSEGLVENLRFHFPSADDGGTQLRLSAAGVARHANDAKMATEFVEWLTSPSGQRTLHAASDEYPANPDVAPISPIDSWPQFAASPIGASRSGFVYQDAILLVQRARYR